MMERTYGSGRTSAALVAAVVLAGCIATTRPPASSTLPAMPAAGLQVYAVGDIADCNHREPADSMAARTSRLVPDGALVLGLGDMAYPQGDAQTLASCYEPTWGRHRAATLVTPGNHDYVRGNAGDFSKYFAVDELNAGGFIAFTPDNLEIHPTKLGCWDLEKHFTRAKFLHAKCYIEESEGKIDEA